MTLTQTGRTPPRLLLAALIAVGTAAIPIYAPALPLVADDLGTSRSAVQQTITWYFVLFAASQLVIGPISDNFGRRKVAIGGLLVFTLGSILGALAPNIESLLIARIIQGAGGAAGTVLARTIVRDVFEGESIARALSQVVTVSALSPIIAPVVGGFAAEWFGWRATMWILAVSGAMTLASILWLLPETSRERGAAAGLGGTLRTYAGLLVYPAFIVNNMIGGLFTSTYYSFLAGMPVVLATSIGLGASEFGTWFAAVPFLYLVGNAASARFGFRFGMERLLEFAVVLTTAGVVLEIGVALLLPLTPASIFLPVLLLALGHGIGNPNANAITMAAITGRAGTAVALLGSMQMALAGVASGIVAIAYNGTIWPVLATMAALQAGIVVLYVVRRATRGVRAG